MTPHRLSSPRGFTLVELVVTLAIFLIVSSVIYHVIAVMSQAERLGSTLIDARASARRAVTRVVDDLRSVGFGIDPTTQVGLEVASDYRVTFVSDLNRDGMIGAGERITYYLDPATSDPGVASTANPNDKVLRRVLSSVANPGAVPTPGKGGLVARGLTQRSGNGSGSDPERPLFTYCTDAGDTLTGTLYDPVSIAFGRTLEAADLGIGQGAIASKVSQVRVHAITEASYKKSKQNDYRRAESQGVAYVAPTIALPGGGGLWAVHIDVDTASDLHPLNNGKTDAHTHEWDDKNGTNVINYFNMLDDKLHEIYEDIDPYKRFKLVIINADLSPAADITINGVTQPVTAYDDISIADLPIFTLGGSSGTTKLTDLEISFERAVAIMGTVHPTKTGAVRANKAGKNGEWRNGALTIQAIEVTVGGTPYFSTDTSLSAGGVQGVATGRMLWESTTFWHWKGPSYDQPGWDEYDPTTRGKK